MTEEIPLTKGFVALVDDDDYERVITAGKWHTHINGRTAYAEHNIQRPSGVRSKITLHTFLTGWPMVDHRNGDGLDNRRANLRPATVAENARNSRVRSSNSSGFHGVGYYKRYGKWSARIRVFGRRIELGYFLTPEEAGRAYDAAAREHFGEFAALNFPAVGERGVR